MISAVVPFAPAVSHPVTSQEYKYEINFAETKASIWLHCVYQSLGFHGAERSQEFTTPYLTNRVDYGELKADDPLRIYQWLKADKCEGCAETRLKMCPGVIDVDILEELK